MKQRKKIKGRERNSFNPLGIYFLIEKNDLELLQCSPGAIVATLKNIWSQRGCWRLIYVCLLSKYGFR